MITTLSSDCAVPVNNMQKMLYDKNLIRKLAVQMVANHVEAHIDMINDAGGTAEYTSFKEVEDCVVGAKVAVEDYVEDLLTEFRDALYEEIRATKIEMSEMIITRDDEIDANVVVSSTKD
jgi:hypothetical protein